MSSTTPSLALALLVGCAGGGSDTSDTEVPALAWYTTCGDPACQAYTGPFDGVPLCTTEAEGDPCSDEGATCDPESECNALVICAAEDPKQQTGGCPISRAAHKTDVQYLSTSEVDALAASVASLPLATWRYTWQEEGQQLGFLIDDAPESLAVRAGGQNVDLYGYTSLTVAAVQAQAREIEALRAELAALRAQVEANGAGTCGP